MQGRSRRTITACCPGVPPVYGPQAPELVRPKMATVGVPPATARWTSAESLPTKRSTCSKSAAVILILPRPAWMHGDDGVLDTLRRFVFIEQLPRLSMIFLAHGYRQAFVAGGRAHEFSYGQVIFGFVHSPEPVVLRAQIEEPAMPIVQSCPPLRAGGTQQHLVLQASKGERKVMEQEHGVIMGIAQIMPERAELQQVARVGEHLLRVVKEIFIQHDHAINNLPTVEQTGGSGRDQQVDLRLGIGFA